MMRLSLTTTIPRVTATLYTWWNRIADARKNNVFASSLGIGLIVATVACAAGFALSGWHELLAASLVLATVIICAFTLSLGGMNIDAAVTVSDTRVLPGDTVTIHIRLSNQNAKTTKAARGDLTLGQIHKHLSIPILRSKSTQQTAVAFTALRRSSIPIGPLLIYRTDPFGVIRRERKLTEQATVFVHPVTIRLDIPPIGLTRDLNGTSGNDAVNDDLDFLDLRPYMPGDDIRRVHWPSTAKIGVTMVRRYYATVRTDTCIALGTASNDYTSAEEFETAVSVYASIGVHCLQQQYPLVAYAGTSNIAPHHPVEFLDWCSDIRPSTSSVSSTPPTLSASSTPSVSSVSSASSAPFASSTSSIPSTPSTQSWPLPEECLFAISQPLAQQQNPTHDQPSQWDQLSALGHSSTPSSLPHQLSNPEQSPSSDQPSIEDHPYSADSTKSCTNNFSATTLDSSISPTFSGSPICPNLPDCSNCSDSADSPISPDGTATIQNNIAANHRDSAIYAVAPTYISSRRSAAVPVNASVHIYVVGPRADLGQFAHYAATLPASSTLLVYRIQLGIQRSTRRMPGFILITLGELNDLPAMMEVLSSWPRFR